MPGIIAAVVIIFIGFLFQSVKLISQGYAALVERLGVYQRTLTGGLHFIIPVMDRIVYQETIREKVVDVPPQQCITYDNVSLMADAVVYWKITDIKKAYYAVEDVNRALVNLVLTALRSEIGLMQLDQTFSSRAEINARLLAELDQATDPWGIKVTRVEVKDIQPSKTVQDSMEKQMAAEREKRASILKSEGDQQSKINQATGEARARVLRAESEKQERLLQAQGTSEALQTIALTLEQQPQASDALQYLLAQGYLDMGLKVGNSPSSKVVFMDPNSVPGALQGMMSMIEQDKTPQGNRTPARRTFSPESFNPQAFLTDSVEGEVR